MYLCGVHIGTFKICRAGWGETVPVSAVYGCFVGSGLDRSGGLVGRHIPNVQICRGGIYPSREHSGCRKLPGRVKTLPYEPTGTAALWVNAHRPHTSARRGRACPARRCTADGRLRETSGPGMPGPYREPKTKTSRPNRRGGSFLCEKITYSSCWRPSCAGRGPECACGCAGSRG